MPQFLLDTNVLSEFEKETVDPRVQAWLVGIDRRSLFVSVATLSEIRFGVDLLSAGKRRSELNRWLERDLQYWFEGRILSVDPETADVWGRLRAKARWEGKPMPYVDSLLAATAIRHTLTVITRNEKDFDVAGLAVLNPWLTA